MDGFTRVPLEEPGFVGRLLGHRPKQNALRAIHNLLADHAPRELAAADVENVLSMYELPRNAAADGLRDLYRTALEYRVTDLRLSDEEIADLRHLRYVLGLEEADANAVEAEFLRAKYRDALKSALADGHLSEAEKATLDAVAANFSLPPDVKASIYKDEVDAVVQEAFNRAMADERLTAEEEQHLATMTANLGVTMTHGEDTRRRIERCRLLAQIENGQLPQVSSDLLLQRGETCHARFDCSLHELRTVTRAVAYHGPSGRIRIMKGLSWRYGYVNVHRVTSEQLKLLDSGTLLITNKRLLFNGRTRNVTLPLTRIVRFALFTDGLQIEKDRGKDQFFKGNGDLELIGAVLETCLRQSR
jgi:hypothetical protein